LEHRGLQKTTPVDHGHPHLRRERVVAAGVENDHAELAGALHRADHLVFGADRRGHGRETTTEPRILMALLAHLPRTVTAIYARWDKFDLRREMATVIERSLRETLDSELTAAIAA
jgi:hypothetical protein